MLFIGNTSLLPPVTLSREQNPALRTGTSLNDKMGELNTEEQWSNPAWWIGDHLGQELGEVMTATWKGQMQVCLELWQFNKLCLKEHF